MKAIIFLTACIMMTAGVNGQQKIKSAAPAPEYVKARLQLKAKGYADKIVLRWAIDNPAGWPLLQQAGVWIERAVLNEQNQLTTKNWVRVNSSPVKPWSANYFQNSGVLQNADNNLLIAAEALYGAPATTVPEKLNTNSLLLAGQEYENKFTMALMAADLSPVAANALGFRYEDSIAVNTKYKYAYRVYSTVNHPVIKIDTAYYFYAGYVSNEKKAPELVMARGLDEKIEVFWPKNNAQNNFTSYNVERSADGKTFTRLNKLPLMFSRTDTTTSDFVFGDSVANYKKWYYRVNGVDAFGDTSYYCAPVSAEATNKNAPPEAYLSARADKKGGVTLRWAQTAAPGRPIAGYVIRRGRELGTLDETVHPQILPQTTSTYTDKPGKLDNGVYYQLITIDTAGNYSFSNIPYVFTNDTIAPKAPTGLTGTIDTLGNVRLSWNHDYTDNVTAYRLFVANNADATFSPVSSGLISDTAYVDKISFTLLNGNIYYQVVAVDGNGNHSQKSPVIELVRPKAVASPAPVIGSFNVLQNSVRFDFSVLPQDDMVQIMVLRRNGGDTEWKSIAQLPVASRQYLDSTVNAGSRYEYAVQTIDKEKRASLISAALNVLVYHAPAEAPKALTLNVNKETITLNWHSIKTPAEFYIIYKDTGSGLMQYKSLPGSSVTFAETNKGRVRYGIKAVFPGQESSAITTSDWVAPQP